MAASDVIGVLILGNLSGIGDCMNTFWKQKQILAKGCNPDLVRELMKKLENETYGQVGRTYLN